RSVFDIVHPRRWGRRRVRPARRPSCTPVTWHSGNQGRGRGTAVDRATGGPGNISAMNTIAGIQVFAWIAIAIVNTVLAWRYTWGLPLTEIPGTTPPAAVVVAVKNASDVSRAFFGRLRHQAYPDYRIIAAVESEEDPAFAMVTEESKRPGAPLQTRVAGQSGRTGQKVWNLLAALDAIETRDEVVAFVDADTLPTPEWLPRLVAALVNTGREAVTGYRWIIPADNRVSSAVVAAATAAVAALSMALQGSVVAIGLLGASLLFGEV